MPKVFALSQPTRLDPVTRQVVNAVNLEPAREHGELVILVPDAHRLGDPALLVDTLYKGLETYQDGDYLLPVGDPILIGIATAIAANINDGRVSFLRWHRREGRYAVSSVVLWEDEVAA